MRTQEPLRIDHTVVIAAAPGRVIHAFFDPRALTTWWQALRSLTTPRVLGVYAIEWEPTEFRDDVLGPLGGVFHGTVIEFHATREFLVGDAYWLPPDGDPIGPMVLNVSCALKLPPVTARQAPSPDQTGAPLGPAVLTLVRVQQRGYEEGPRWRRYYEVVDAGWQRALGSLKNYLER